MNREQAIENIKEMFQIALREYIIPNGTGIISCMYKEQCKETLQYLKDNLK